MKIGKRLKLLRQEREMTLQKLADKSGVQMATLSRMEHNIMTGTLKSHVNICKALSMNLADFYRELEDEYKTVSLLRRKEKYTPSMSPRESTIELLTTKFAGKKMMPTLIRIKKDGGSPKEENRVGTEKFIYILEGKIKASVGKEEYILGKGDSIYFDASLPHVFRNASKAESLVLSVISPPAA